MLSIPLPFAASGNARRWACQIVQFAASCLEPARCPPSRTASIQPEHTTCYLVAIVRMPHPSSQSVAYRLLCMFRDIMMPLPPPTSPSRHHLDSLSACRGCLSCMQLPVKQSCCPLLCDHHDVPTKKAVRRRLFPQSVSSLLVQGK
jgi:hypothetical protein